jgi:hypothetical protein
MSDRWDCSKSNPLEDLRREKEIIYNSIGYRLSIPMGRKLFDWYVQRYPEFAKLKEDKFIEVIEPDVYINRDI